MKKLMLIYPPGRIFQRGEERCQSNIKASTSTSMRACNDLGYCAAVMRNLGWNIFLRDYQTEGVGETELLREFTSFAPDALLLSSTNATLFEDLALLEKLKAVRPSLRIILKGGIFYDPPQELLDNPQLAIADFLIAEELECVIDRILSDEPPRDIPRIFYRQNGMWVRSENSYFEENLDRLPFPARDLMNNTLYVRPDTGEPQATISTSRGCPSQCTFCLTPAMTGRKVRFRSPENVVAEMEECLTRFQIRNFFFRADTFTINRDWCMKLCRLILEKQLEQKIAWVANARANTLDLELLTLMRTAGCWLIAVGFESGSPESLRRIKKGITPELGIRAAQLVRASGIKLFGFFMIGFPWESMEHLRCTEKYIFDVTPDFLELHIATPFYGTALYQEMNDSGKIHHSLVGCDYFAHTFSGTDALSAEELANFRTKVLRRYVFRPGYILRRLVDALSDRRIFCAYFQHAMELFGMLFLKRG